MIRDTAELPKFLRPNGTSRKLKELAEEYLGLTIQDGIHCPEQDARAAMELYKKHWKMNGPAPRIRWRKDEPQRYRKTYEYYFDKCDVGYEDDDDGCRESDDGYREGDDGCLESDDGVDYLSLDYQNYLFDYFFYD